MRFARFASIFVVALFVAPFGCSSSSSGSVPDAGAEDTGVYTTRPDDDTGVASDATDDATDAFDASDASGDGTAEASDATDGAAD